MRIAGPLVAVVLSLAAACSDSTTTGGGSGTSGSSSSGSSGASSSGTSGTSGAALTGTINGVAFTPLSAVAYANSDGTTDLVFSDKADLCTRLVDKEIAAGETLVQLLGLVASSGGSYAPPGDPSDLKVAVFDATCGVTYSSSASATFHITLTKNDASGADGTANVTFDSKAGAATSTIAGSFSATTCAATIEENDTCK